MKQWEYLIETIEFDPDPITYAAYNHRARIDHLNMRGLEGWELVSQETAWGASSFTFKRERLPTNPDFD